MANEPYITKDDLENVTQKVAIQNSKDIAKPLIDQQKKNDLKELEKSIEQRALFQDIAAGIKGLGKSLIDGLKSLIPKTDGGLSKLLGLGLGLLLAPFVGFIAFITQLGVELKFFSKLISKPLGFIFGPVIKWFKTTKLSKKIISLFTKITDKFKKLFAPIKKFLTKNKFIQKVVATFKKLFSGKKGFFSKLMKFAKGIIKFATGGPFKTIIGFAGKIGRIMGKVFLPITILMGIFDFVKGFMKGYKEDGIVGGIKEGFNSLFEGLIGGLLRILMWIPTKIAEWLGFDNLAAEIGKYTETIIQSVKDVFGGLVDLVKAIWDWDTEEIKKSFGVIWDGITSAVKAPFELIHAFLQDVFGDNFMDPITDTINRIKDGITAPFDWLANKIGGVFSGFIPETKIKLKEHEDKSRPGLNEVEFKNGTIIIPNKVLDTLLNPPKPPPQRAPGDINFRPGDRTPVRDYRGSSLNGNSSPVVNNITYNISAPNDLAGNALRNAMRG